MQLLNALCTLAVLLPSALASPSHLPHAIHHRDIDYSALEARQNSIIPGSTPRCTKRGAHLVITSGHGSPNTGGYGLLASTTVAIKAQIPYSNNMSTAYDKDNDNIATSVMDGVGNLTAHIEWYTAGCPNTPIILLGYSQGAIVTSNTLCGRSVKVSPVNAGIDMKYAAQVAAIILYGDETRTPTHPYNYGTCTTGSGVNPRQQSATCGIWTSSNILRSWCDENDPMCCVTQSPMPDMQVHYVYPGEYDGAAAAFAAERFASWKAAKENGTPWPVVDAVDPSAGSVPAVSPSATAA